MARQKLIPPDKKQCQAEHQIGTFGFGGKIGARTRCLNKPIAIITEMKKGRDGLIGSMSVCEECLGKAQTLLNNGFHIKMLK